ncbi:hypothetical protein LF1_29300 [Rubripirellula obstinata]|uniref:Uncharacterized protein n=1 Tax=Rubripirellula obstinata TaxID=406547 RepID=A0A5B1CLH2_9BACT|nr:methylamine utilization protein [Rubripirellula obstinata]KAA1260390.1 hypothetical protein LF1_29300 [Rubripirellula obstinata]
MKIPAISAATTAATTAAIAIAFLFTTLHSSAAETGDLKIQFKYGGDAPEAKSITPTADGEYCGKHEIVDPRLLVNGENQGLKNVLVYVYTGRGGSDLDYDGGEPETKELANQDCQFEPHIVIAKAGDTLKVTNPDEIGHNANIQFFKNDSVNPMIPAGQEILVELEEPEPAPITVSCNIHPWMTAKLVVLDHPYAAVSDSDGNLVIKGLPVGEELVFRMFHESARIKEAEVDGKKVKWKKSRFEVKIQPGVNDMGTVVLDADQFD